MKVQASVKKRCARCQLVRRGKYLRVICLAKKSHKQRQG